MTDTQFQRLPELLRQIVVIDRVLSGYRKAPVVGIAAFGEARARRKELRAAAQNTWGFRLGGDRAAN